MVPSFMCWVVEYVSAVWFHVPVNAHARVLPCFKCGPGREAEFLECLQS